MERWVGKVALVTGASAGIGAAIAVDLVKNGLKVIGLARREERVQELAEKLNSEPGKLFPFKGDVAKLEDIEAVFKFIEEKFGTLHVLVNNAGIIRSELISNGKIKNFQDIINVNLVAPTIFIKKTIQIMATTGVNDGHIININSVAGHSVPNMPAPILNVYPASKFGLTALTETVRQELRYLKTNTRVTSISPGSVSTEIGAGAAAESSMTIPDELIQMFMNAPTLQPTDVSEAVIYVLGTPPHVQVHEIIIKPVGEM